MAGLVGRMISNYNELFEQNKDPLIETWPFMSSPVPVYCALGAYLIFVLKLGPKMMENRPAFQLKTVLILYNGIQVLFSVWLCIKSLQSNFLTLLFAKLSDQNEKDNMDQLQHGISAFVWWYFVAKMTELLDTVFFVLRKKQNQVTFLHVYHHTLMAFGTWNYLKLSPGGQAIVPGFLNALVHVVMYSYYLIAALGPAYQKYIWWKKYITKMQLAQFGIIFFYLMYLLAIDSALPKGITYFFAVNAVIFVYLFTDFYTTAYRKKTA